LVTGVGKVRLGLEALLLDHCLVIDASGAVLLLIGAEILLLSIDHDQNLPRSPSIFRDSYELRASELGLGAMASVAACLRDLRSSNLLLRLMDHHLIGSLIYEDLRKLPPPLLDGCRELRFDVRI
jgi:hypothetical protein